MNHFPNFHNHFCLYNIKFNKSVNDAGKATNKLNSYIATTDKLPPLRQKEFDAARNSTYLCLQQNGRPASWTQKQAISLYRYCIRDEPFDRTVRLVLPDLQYFNLRLVEALQREVLSSRPLWRIMLIGTTHESTVIIYPNGMWFYDLCEGEDPTEKLENLIQRERTIVEELERQKNSQIQYMKTQISKEICLFEDKPLRLVAAFDNWRGNPHEWTICILWKTDENWCTYSLSLPSNAASGSKWPIREDGTFGPDYDADNPPFWLTQWVVPAGFSGKLVLERIRPGPYVDGQWSIEFDPSSIVPL